MAAFLALRGAPPLRCLAPPLGNALAHSPLPRFPNAARAVEIDLLFYERSKVAEALRDRETRKAVRLQSAHRGRALRLEVAEWNAMALLIERCTRGHLGRQQARRLRIGRDTKRQRSFFDALATTVQKRFRAYHVRKYRHNFYARKAYVASVLRKGDQVCEDLRTRMDEQVREALETQELQARERVNSLSKRLHHLRSTATCAGIYNSAYHLGQQPTAFGVPVETHLRDAIRPVVRAEVALRQRNIGPLPPLSPINPHRVEMSYDYVVQQAREEKWLSKTGRVGGAEFNPNGGVTHPGYGGSIHVGSKYHPPLNLERAVEKEKWVGTKPFCQAVPTGRIVNSAGGMRRGASREQTDRQSQPREQMSR